MLHLKHMTPTLLKSHLANHSNKIVEICGPSPKGYELLQKWNISLPTNLIVTNISNPITINPFGDNPETFEVDEVQDIRRLTYGASSVGTLLVSYLPHYDQKESDYLLEYDNPGEPKHNLHVFLYKEAGRVLQKGGLLIQVGPFSSYEKAAQYYGLRVAFIDEETATVIFEKNVKK